MTSYLNQSLIEACCNGDVDAMKYFISRGADVNCKNNQMRFGNLGTAIENCGTDYHKLKCLIEHGAEVPKTCLWRSFNLRDVKVCSLLVDKGKLELKAVDIVSAVSFEISVNNINVIKYVLEKHKPCISVFLTTRNPDYWGSLDYSTQKYRWDNRSDEYSQWRNDIINLKNELEMKVRDVMKYVEV